MVIYQQGNVLLAAVLRIVILPSASGFYRVAAILVLFLFVLITVMIAQLLMATICSVGTSVIRMILVVIMLHWSALIVVIFMLVLLGMMRLIGGFNVWSNLTFPAMKTTYLKVLSLKITSLLKVTSVSKA